MRTEMATFNVVEIPYAYKVIFKRGIIINRFNVVEIPYEAFEQLKSYLENLAVLTSPGDKAKLLLYIATSASAVSTALVEEK
jgi:hypothetical protein